MMPRMAKDTKTRFQGVFARHREGCGLEDGKKCSCKPGFYGRVFDRETKKRLNTSRFPTPTQAAEARGHLREELAQGTLPSRSPLLVRDGIDRFLDAAGSGVALNKHGRRYKPSAVRDLTGCLRNYVQPALGHKKLSEVRRADCQRLVDDLHGKSGSTVRSIVNAIRSLYRWAQDRELVENDPAVLVRLPAMDAKPRDRIATPHELARLLGALPISDALPFALAAYATARRGEIRHLTLDDVDLQNGVIHLGADEQGRKSRAAQRTVPIVKPLARIIREAQMASGAREGLLCPGHKPGGGNSGLLSFEALQARADRSWEKAGLTRITAHECRHTAISWLDAAGVRGKVISTLAGHSYRHEGAGVTSRYTHVLPDDIREAGVKLDAWIARETARDEATG